jgi:cytidylate kinase
MNMAVITISRQYGTGGINIGRKVAENLGYSFMYIEEFVAASKEQGLDIDFERIEGRPPKVIERLFGLNRESVRETLKTVMENAAANGNVIIGGWGGQVLLNDRPGVLHLRIVGSNESRTRHIMDSAGMPRSQAEEIVEKTDRDQSLFSNYFFKVDFSNPKLYHGVINIDQSSPEDICEMVPVLLGEMETASA